MELHCDFPFLLAEITHLDDFFLSELERNGNFLELLLPNQVLAESNLELKHTCHSWADLFLVLLFRPLIRRVLRFRLLLIRWALIFCILFLLLLGFVWLLVFLLIRMLLFILCFLFSFHALMVRSLSILLLIKLLVWIFLFLCFTILLLISLVLICFFSLFLFRLIFMSVNESRRLQ